MGLKNVDIRGFIAEGHGDFGLFRFIPSDPVAAEAWLTESGYGYRWHEACVPEVPNEAGALGRVCGSLRASGIHVNACHPGVPEGATMPRLAFSVDDAPTACKVLGG